MKASESHPIAILGGTGPAGMGVALRWARAGETIIFGSRDARRAQEAARRSGKRTGPQAKISGMENSAACAAAEVLVLTVPFEGQAALLKQLKPSIRAGSILIDATVALAAASVDECRARSASGKVRLPSKPSNSRRRESALRRRFTIYRLIC